MTCDLMRLRGRLSAVSKSNDEYAGVVPNRYLGEINTKHLKRLRKRCCFFTVRVQPRMKSTVICEKKCLIFLEVNEKLYLGSSLTETACHQEITLLLTKSILGHSKFARGIVAKQDMTQWHCRPAKRSVLRRVWLHLRHHITQ